MRMKSGSPNKTMINNIFTVAMVAVAVAIITIVQVRGPGSCSSTS